MVMLMELLGQANPYFVRHAATPNCFKDAMTKIQLSFFTNWISSNDVLAFCY